MNKSKQQVKIKHFLDTSIFRQYFFSTSAYKEYLKKNIDSEKSFVSEFVRLEVIRSYLATIIEFYFLLDIPTLKNVDEVLQFWHHHFQASRHKAILQLISKLFANPQIDINELRSKDKAKNILAIEIKKHYLQFKQKFKNISNNTPRCYRASIKLNIFSKDFNTELVRFKQEFDDVKNCRNHCRIDNFILSKYSSEVNKLIEDCEKQGLSQSNCMRKICDKLQNIKDKGSSACNCRMCGSIGDSIIGIDCPGDYQIEHTDKSFDYICPSLNKNHRKLVSEPAFLKNPHM